MDVISVILSKKASTTGPIHFYNTHAFTHAINSIFHRFQSTLLYTVLLGQTDSKMDYSHDITHGMKKLRLQAQKRLQATLLTDDSSGKSDKMKTKLPNPKFIFHNKIPKSGSTTLANIVHTLEERNRFKLRHFHPCVNERK